VGTQSPSGRRQPAATIPEPNERNISLPHFMAPKTCQPGQGAQRCVPVQCSSHSRPTRFPFGQLPLNRFRGLLLFQQRN